MAKIVIDPGHFDGYNPGVCPDYFEGNAMLVLSKYLGAALTARGADVKYTRTTGSQNPSLDERGQMAAGADLFISMHSDASDNPDARGVTAYYSVKQPGSEPFAAEIGMAAADAMGNQFRGTQARPYPGNPNLDYYGVIRAAVAAGAKNAFLMEHGFHTNSEDCAILNNEAALRRIAEAEANVIASYFGLSGGGGEVMPPQCCQFRYTVQPGEYLYLIGHKFGVSWETIASVNGLMPPYTLYPGQVITIPLCS